MLPVSSFFNCEASACAANISAGVFNESDIILSIRVSQFINTQHKYTPKKADIVIPEAATCNNIEKYVKKVLFFEIMIIFEI